MPSPVASPGAGNRQKTHTRVDPHCTITASMPSLTLQLLEAELQSFNADTGYRFWRYSLHLEVSLETAGDTGAQGSQRLQRRDICVQISKGKIRIFIAPSPVNHTITASLPLAQNPLATLTSKGIQLKKKKGKKFMFISSTNQKHARKNKRHFSRFCLTETLYKEAEHS